MAQKKAASGTVPFLAAVFGLAVAIVAAAVLFAQIQSVRSEIEAVNFEIRRVNIVLSAIGLTLEPVDELGRPQFGLLPQAQRSEIQVALDRSRVATAVGQLRDVQRSFLMHRAESFKPEYPPTDSISTYADLNRFLSEYRHLPPAQETLAWVFLCYYCSNPEEYLLVTEAKDSRRTLITITPTQITSWYQE